MIFILIIIEIIEIIEFYRIHKEYEKSINLLHLECEGYLKVLNSVGAIPDKILKEKIDSMNKKYGSISLKIK